MAREVKGHVAQCLQCEQGQEQGGGGEAEPAKLALVGVGQRWSLDFAGELPISKRGKKYILVIIDHASKWVEAAATEDKSSATVARVFLNKVIARFGGCATVLTDQGREFRGAFEEMLNESRGGTQLGPPAPCPKVAMGWQRSSVSTVRAALRQYAMRVRAP